MRLRRPPRLAVLTAALLLGCASTETRSLTSSNATVVDDVQRFLRNPDGRQARISPDGTKVAIIITVDRHDTILVWDVGDKSKRPILRFPDLDAQLAWVEWANDHRLVFGVDIPLIWSQGVRARGTLLYAVDADGQNLAHLGAKWFGRGEKSKTYRTGQEFVTHPIQFEDRVLSMLPEEPDQILVQLERPTDRNPGVYRVDVESGKLQRAQPPTGQVVQWYADFDGAVRLGHEIRGSDSQLIVRQSAGDEFTDLPQGDGGYSFVAYSSDPRLIYVTTAGGSDRDSLYEYHLDTMKLGREILSHPLVDIDAKPIIDPWRRAVLGFTYVVDRRQTHYLDAEAERLQQTIDRALPDRYNEITSRSRDGRRMLVASESDVSPPSIYLFDRDAHSMGELYRAYPDLADTRLGPTRILDYETRDGRTIRAYLTIPPGAADSKLPVVVMPHGGPAARDYIDYDPEIQFLAHRGYAVFRPNFRGSSGFGSDHEHSGYKQWGLAMQDDITDGVRWLIDQGIADPDRIAIFGTSYGGYAALMGLATTPDLYRCGASLAGVTDLLSMISENDWYEHGSEYSEARIGSAWSDRERLIATSPLNNVDKIRAPVFVAHGKADSRVHVKQANAFADAMRGAGKDVEVMLFDDEIHGLRNETYRIEFYTRLIEFLDRNMAPRDGTARLERNEPKSDDEGEQQ